MITISLDDSQWVELAYIAIMEGKTTDGLVTQWIEETVEILRRPAVERGETIESGEELDDAWKSAVAVAGSPRKAKRTARRFTSAVIAEMITTDGMLEHMRG
jgi:hypothetical protein